MQDNSFEQLAAEAAAGLKADSELFLDVKEELRAHLEEKADRFAREEHAPAECVALAKQSFGSPLDVAAELLAVNRGRMRLRAALRLAFAALVVPLAMLLALYVGYGRLARLNGMVMSIAGGGSMGDTLKLPTLPGMAPEDATATAPEIVRLLAGHIGNNSNILHYWEQHRDEPDGPMYYALYAEFADDFDGASYVTIMRRGEQIEPQNALYNVLLAEYYLNKGVLAQDNRELGKHGEKLPDELLDRRYLALGDAELCKAVRKPYLRTYQMMILQKRLNALPPPRLTEDYLNRFDISAAVLFPCFSHFRNLARHIPGSARLLIADGQPGEAEAVMDTWRPLTGLMLNDDTDRTLIQELVAQAVGAILSKEGADVYDRLGASARAADARAAYARLSQAKTEFRAEKSATISEVEMHKHVSLLGSILYPVFGGEPHPARTHRGAHARARADGRSSGGCDRLAAHTGYARYHAAKQTLALPPAPGVRRAHPAHAAGARAAARGAAGDALAHAALLGLFALARHRRARIWLGLYVAALHGGVAVAGDPAALAARAFNTQIYSPALR